MAPSLPAAGRSLLEGFWLLLNGFGKGLGPLAFARMLCPKGDPARPGEGGIRGCRKLSGDGVRDRTSDPKGRGTGSGIGALRARGEETMPSACGSLACGVGEGEREVEPPAV